MYEAYEFIFLKITDYLFGKMLFAYIGCIVQIILKKKRTENHKS